MYTYRHVWPSTNTQSHKLKRGYKLHMGSSFISELYGGLSQRKCINHRQNEPVTVLTNILNIFPLV